MPEFKTSSIDAVGFLTSLARNTDISPLFDAAVESCVLVLGRFADHLTVLKSLQDELRKKGYIPLLFDFDRPKHRTVLETVCALACFAKFVIADYSDAKQVLLEVPAVLGSLATPILPILRQPWDEPAELERIRAEHPRCVLPTIRYETVHDLLEALEELLKEAEERFSQLRAESDR